MSDDHAPMTALAELGSLQERIDAVAEELVGVRRDLVSEVAKRRREQAKVARLLLEREEREASASVQNPAFAWHDLRGWIRSGSDQPARLLAYYPAGLFNPYMEMLYSRVAEHGWISSPLSELSDIDSLQPGDLFHLHWTKFVTSTASSRSEAATEVDRTLGTIDRALNRGVRFAWTVHELAPHECPFPDEEFRLRRGLTERASFVHVLHQSTEQEVGQYYAIPRSKLVLAEHPLYTGFYPRFVPRESARKDLGLGDETIFLSFGTIRPYKGIDRLAAAVDAVNAGGVARCKLIVAGPTYQNVEVSDLLLTLNSSPHTMLAAAAIPPSYVHVLFEAADVAVLPYRAFHNSGVAMLALTFGTPVLVPETTVTRELEDSGMVEYFDGTDGGLVKAVGRLAQSPPERQEPEREFARRFDPHRVAGRFAEALGRLR